MKITVKNKKPEVKKIFIKDVLVGYVFEIYISDSESVKALKLDNGVTLLEYSAGNDWFSFMKPDEICWKDTPVKILGRLIEIIVGED